MARKKRSKKDATAKQTSNGANLGFEEKLWLAADKLRGNLDAAEYKHVVLGLIFLKYISDAFESRRAQLVKLCDDPTSDYYVEDEAQKQATLEDRDEYLSGRVFWVPEPARWHQLQAAAKKPEIGKLIDEAMEAIERENPRLKAVLPKRYARPDLDKRRLGELIDLIGTISVGTDAARSQDILGRTYEYFLGKFASAEGKLGGEFYTPRCVVRLLVEMLEPYKGRVFDPCCGSGGMFVSSESFVEAHGGRAGDISVYGQESNPTTWRLCQMNLAIRGIEAHLGDKWGDSFHEDLHKDLKADFILANPPFNVSDWGGQRRENNRCNSTTLAAIRDALLPKLLSGEIRVGTAEGMIEEAVSGGDGAERVQEPLLPGFDEPEPMQVAVATVERKARVTARSEAVAAAAPQRTDEVDTDDVMAAFRQAIRGQTQMDREDLLRAVAHRLGYQRLGSAIRDRLKGHLRAAIRRRIIGTEGADTVYPETRTMADYTRDELVDVVRSLVRPGRTCEREEVIEAVARHLGFARIRDTVRQPVKSAINAAIRRGVLGYQGSEIWRE